MKKRSIFVVSLTVFLFIFTNSCINEPNLDDINRPPSEAVRERLLQDAKRMFYASAHRDGMVALRTGNNENNENDGSLSVSPDWEDSSVEQNDRYQTLEIVLLMENTFHFATSETAERIEAAQNHDYALSKTSLIHRTHRQTGETVMFLMTIVPDLSYLERTGFEPFEAMSYLRRDSRFDGLVFFHDLNGEFVNGWVYRDGEIIGTMDMPDEAPEFEIGTRSSVCWVAPMTTTFEWCWHTANASGQVTHSVCNTFSAVSYISVCAFVDGGIDFGGGGNSGNDGGFLPPPPPPPAPPPYAEAPYARSLFEGNLTRAQWDALEARIREMGEDCMGANLYRALANTDPIRIEFNPTGGDWFCPTDRKMSLSSLNDCRVLFHEMFHAHQAINYVAGSTLNKEVEAWFASTLYVFNILSGDPPRGWETEWEWERDPILGPTLELWRYVDNRGNLRPGRFILDLNRQVDRVIDMFRISPAYEGRPFNRDRRGLANFENIRKLTKDCD